MLALLLSLAVVAAAPQPQGCLFDGRMYTTGAKIMFGDCLGAMTCLGNNNYGNLVQYGGECPTKRDDGQIGCLFDGTMYNTGDTIIIKGCLGEMTCLGNYNLSPSRPVKVCPDTKRSADGQSGCLYDGTVYSKGDHIPIPGTTTTLICQGHNIYTEQFNQL